MFCPTDFYVYFYFRQLHPWRQMQIQPRYGHRKEGSVLAISHFVFRNNFKTLLFSNSCCYRAVVVFTVRRPNATMLLRLPRWTYTRICARKARRRRTKTPWIAVRLLRQTVVIGFNWQGTRPSWRRSSAGRLRVDPAKPKLYNTPIYCSYSTAD